MRAKQSASLTAVELDLHVHRASIDHVFVPILTELPGGPLAAGDECIGESWSKLAKT